METLIQENKIDFKAQKELERNLIKSLAGKYKVTFRFAETFAPNKDYNYRPRHFSEAREVAFVIEDSEDKISIQHVLLVGKGQFIKHWRQDWIYENREFLHLIKDHEWEKRFISEEQARGTWTQKVYQVDDCPRYEGYGTWIHADGRHFWESTADAALPRREVLTNGRTDYNVLRRHSHIEIFEDGSWMLEQDNEKINRLPDGQEELICLEKGLENFYPEAYDDQAIHDHWRKNENYWADVRKIWSEIIASQDHILIHDDVKLYEQQSKLAQSFEGDRYNQSIANEAIRKLLAEHVEGFKA